MAQARSVWVPGTLLIALLFLCAPLGAQESAGDDLGIPTREEAIDHAGVAYGLTFGNLIYPGFKAATMILAAPQAGLAWILSLGDTEQARTIWDAQTEGPYYIGPEEARRALGLDAESEPLPYADPELGE